VLHHKVFGGKQFGELGLDFVVDGHWWFFELTVLYEKRRSCDPLMYQFGKWF
jgi:hypothetical protein